MHRLLDNKEPVSTYLIEVTPQQLRMIADRLDNQLKNSVPGQSIVIPFAQDITLVMTGPNYK